MITNYFGNAFGKQIKKGPGVCLWHRRGVGRHHRGWHFAGPASIAAILPSPTLILLCWLLVGLYILLSASSYAELTTMLPLAGGAYNYIKRAFGGYAGFVNGWFDFLCNVMAPAYFCIVLSEYTALLFPQVKPYNTFVALSFLTLFTLLNLPGVKGGSATQQLTSAVKVLLFLVLVAGCFFATPEKMTTTANFHKQVTKGGIITAVFRSLQLITGSFDGWMAVSFFAEENDDPQRSIPKSYLVGALAITIIYVLINAAIFYV